MLWLLAVAGPLLALFLVWAWRKRQTLMRRFVQERLLSQLTVGYSPARQKLRLVLVGLAAILLLVALARPQYGFAWEEARQRGLDIVVAIDTSRSMLAADVAPDRLTRAKLAALDLQRLARSDRLALVAFAGTAFLQCPPTLDDHAFQQSLNLLSVDLLPQGGTALAAAIEVGLGAFKDSGSNHRVMVLFSDGEDHEGDAAAAAARAAEQGVKIFTVGVGTPAGDRLRQVDAQGRTTYILDEQGQPVVSRLNAELLQEIARRTGGDYLPLVGADPMRALYEARLAPLPKSDLGARWSRHYHERFQWPLGLAILLLMLEMLLSAPRRTAQPLPAAAVNSPQPGGAANTRRRPATVASLLLLMAAPSAWASASGALRDYERGQYRSAEREYRRLLERRPDDARLHYNAGTAAYAAGDWNAATNHLEAATRTSDPDLLQRVYYNLGNAFYRLGEEARVPALTFTNWQQALQHYESALRLDPQDADAAFNRDLVKIRLEELQRQMTPPSPPPPSQGQHQQSRQSAQPSPQSHQQSPAAKGDQDPQQPTPPEAAQDPGQSDESPPQDQPPEAEQGTRQEPAPRPEQSPKPESKSDSGSVAEASGEKPPESETRSAPATVTGPMTPEQARQLLEAARMHERPWQPAPPRDRRKTNRPFRDW